MQITDVRPECYIKQLRCDRCDLLAENGESEFFEFLSVDLTAGYGSIFGDGNQVQIDLCQRCLKASLGQWLRVREPNAGRVIAEKSLLDSLARLECHSGTLADDRPQQDRLARFDPGRHGGEFPDGEPGKPPRGQP